MSTSESAEFLFGELFYYFFIVCLCKCFECAEFIPLDPQYPSQSLCPENQKLD